MRRSTQFNFPMLLVSLVLGAAAWLIGLLIYNAAVDVWPRPLLIGVLFGSLALLVPLGILIVSNLQSTFEQDIITGGSAGSAIVLILIAALLITGLGTLFQWLYGLRSRDLPTSTSYIFIIDDSGSMATNDPDQLRYSAIDEVLKGQSTEFTYTVYSFADSVSVLRPMQPSSGSEAPLAGISSGGTYIKRALKQVLADYQSGVWDGGKRPKVILLTDGYASDIPFFFTIRKTLKEYSKCGISISTVGLGDVDTSLMERIAETTGGIFVDISDAAMLGEAMKNAASHYSADDLLTVRSTVGKDFLYGFLRVLFLTLLGLCIGLVSAVAYGQMDSSSLVLLSSGILSLIGALLMELLTAIGFPDKLCWFLLWLLIAAMVCTQQVTSRGRGPSRPAYPSRRSGRSSQILR